MPASPPERPAPEAVEKVAALAPHPLLREGDPMSAEDAARLLSENPWDVIYRSGLDRRAVWISPSMEVVSDWTVAELLGTVIDELVHPDDWRVADETRRRLRAGEVVVTARTGSEAPMRVRMKSGEYRWFSVIGVPWFEADGSPGGIVGRLRDVDDLVRAREAAQTEERRLRATLDSFIDPHVVLTAVRDSDGRIVDLEFTECNTAACAELGIAREELIGSTLTARMRPEGLWLRDAAVACVETGRASVIDGVAFPRPTSRRRYDVRAVPRGDVVNYTWRDVSERFETEERIAEMGELYRLVTEEVTDAVARFRDDGTLTWVSPSFERLTGYPASEVVGGSGYRLGDQADGVLMSHELDRLRAGAASTEVHLRLHTRDGDRRWVAVRVRPFTRLDGETDGFVAVLVDIDEKVQAQDRLTHEIGHDAVTGVANRRLAVSRLTRALDGARSGRRSVGVVALGVDRLTAVNQALGYAAGDRVLAAVAQRVALAVGDPDRVARIAGDEFVVLVPDLDDVAELAALAARLRDAVHGRLDVGAHVVEPTVSIGVVAGSAPQTAEELMRQASLGVRQAKDAGRDRWQFVDAGLAAEARDRLSVEADLRQSLLDGRVEPWFQPVVSLADRVLRGYEALARCRGLDGGIVPPDEFLPAAERSGLVVDIDMAVLARSLDVLAVVPVEHIAVNVSAATLRTPDYVQRVADVLAGTRVDPARLRLEVTETALLGVTSEAAAAMRDVAALGPRWYVDDFGTGYSSISHLRDLPVAGLKLDRSFTSGIGDRDMTCTQLAQGLAGLATGLQLDTVAEGIETEAEAGVLQGQGWHHGQGWLFGRPEPLGL